MSTCRVEVSCPACGHTNYHCLDVVVHGDPFVDHCSTEDGGCGSPYAIRYRFKPTVEIAAIPDWEEKQHTSDDELDSWGPSA